MDVRSWDTLVLSILKIIPNKDLRQEPATKNKFSKQKENNDIVQHSVDESILQENKKLSVKYETRENIDSEVYEDELHGLDKMSLDDK